jgi:hypothetical protein
MILSEGAIIEIKRAEYIGEYKLRLQFSDGQERLVDFEPFLLDSSNPLIRKYLDLEKFKQFTLEYGDLQWNDYDLCFPVADLYEGRINE